MRKFSILYPKIVFARAMAWLESIFGTIGPQFLNCCMYPNTKRLTLGLLTIPAMIFGCVHKITINSNPTGADVWLINTRGPGRTALGKTPLNEKVIPNTEAAVLEIDKTGFLPKQVVIGLIPGAKYNIATTLQPLSPEYLAEQSRKDFSRRLNENIKELRKIRTAITARIPEILELKDLVSAQKSAEVLKQEALMKDAWSGIAIFHQLLGDFYLAEGNVAEARKRYNQALKIDPTNVEIQKRIQTLPSGGE